MKETCKASSDDLNCYEFSGGFRCYRNDGHGGLHRAEEGQQVIRWGVMEDWNDVLVNPATD